MKPKTMEGKDKCKICGKINSYAFDGNFHAETLHLSINIKPNTTEREYMNLKIEVGKEIKKARLYRKLTQKQLADRLGTKQQVITRWENGNQLPTLKTMERIGKALGAQTMTIGMKDLVKHIHYF